MNNIRLSKYLPLIMKHFDHKYDEANDTLYVHFDNPNAIVSTQSYIDDHVVIQLDKKEMPINITIYNLHQTIENPQAKELLAAVPDYVIRTAEKVFGVKI